MADHINPGSKGRFTVCVTCLGADAVLGHVTSGQGSVAGSGRGTSGVSREQEIRRMKHSPGSGVLAVIVVPDGPTRILRVTDENKKVREPRSCFPACLVKGHITYVRQWASLKSTIRNYLCSIHTRVPVMTGSWWRMGKWLRLRRQMWTTAWRAAGTVTREQTHPQWNWRCVLLVPPHHMTIT